MVRAIPIVVNRRQSSSIVVKSSQRCEPPFASPRCPLPADYQPTFVQLNCTRGPWQHFKDGHACFSDI